MAAVRITPRTAKVKTQTLSSAACAVLFGVALASLQVSASKLETRWMSLHAKASVGADGRVTDVALVEDKVSATIKSTVVNNLKHWQFVPVLVNGVAVPALTYVDFDACAIPSGDGYDLAIKYIGNGPLLDGGMDLEWSPTINLYTNDHQSIKIRIRVAADGHAEMQDVVMIDVPPMIQRDIRHTIKEWVGSLHYQPEQIAGQPVATDIEWPMNLDKRLIGVHYGQADAAADPACAAARSVMDKPHSSNSPLKLRDGSKTPDANMPAK